MVRTYIPQCLVLGFEGLDKRDKHPWNVKSPELVRVFTIMGGKRLGASNGNVSRRLLNKLRYEA